VVLSHLHEDHWDRVAEAALSRSLPIVTTPHAAEHLGRKGFAAAEALGTWQTLAVRRGDVVLRVTSMPGRHGPRLVSRLLPAVMGSLLEFETTRGELLLRLYITGDTLVYEGLHEIRARYDDIDLALLHLGGTRVLGILVTMDGEQGRRAMQIVQPRLGIPIHYDDYPVFRSPLEDFQREIDAAGLRERVHYMRRGDEWTFRARTTVRTQGAALGAQP
jgi:L-ascorbate metabolism protein UlaG (beta-lactamase superfamily)